MGGKIKITKEAILAPFLKSIRTFMLLPLAGAMISVGLAVMYALGNSTDTKATVRHAGAIIIVMAVFIIAPYLMSFGIRKAISSIRNDNFYIIGDIIVGKRIEAVRGGEEGNLECRCLIMGHKAGFLPPISQFDWVSCIEGDPIFVFMQENGIPIAAFLADRYYLPDELRSHFVQTEAKFMISEESADAEERP